MKNLKLYFDVGLPEGHDTVIDGTEFTLMPMISGVSPNSGSIGGSLIVADVQGVGPFSNDLDADQSNQITLFSNSTNSNICSYVYIREYGKLECMTNARFINTTQLMVKSYVT